MIRVHTHPEQFCACSSGMTPAAHLDLDGYHARFPTMVSFTQGSPEPFSDALMRLLVYYRWNRIAVLFDVAYDEVRPRTRVQCGPVRASLRAPGNNMTYIELFTSSLGNMTDALAEAQKFTRSINLDL